MDNNKLADLNFREIIDYGGQPPVQHWYVPPLKCKGYCIECEKKNILETTGGQLTRMSHGCDSADYEAILGPMLPKDQGITAPIIFLLENPGSGRGIFQRVDFQGYFKEPPVNHYYWAPKPDGWPDCLADVITGGNFYNPYFAYLMNHHQLYNVYITNLVKCKWTKYSSHENGDGSAITQHCANRHLKKELEIFAPDLVICFGANAARGFRDYCAQRCPRTNMIQLLHPAYIERRWRADRRGRSQEQLFEENDLIISAALKQLP